METRTTHSNISLHIDVNNSTTSLEKLKYWNPQNFTSILNRPNVKIIFYLLSDF